MTAADKRLESHWRLLVPSEYMCAADLRSRDVTLRIKSVSQKDLPIEGSSDKKLAIVITFDDPNFKPLVANKTNLRSIESLHGGYVTDWIGKSITLYPTKKEAGPKGRPIKDPKTRRIVEAIRVRVRPGASDDAPDTDTDSTADGPKEQTA